MSHVWLIELKFITVRLSTIALRMMGWWLFGQAVSKSYSFWIFLLSLVRQSKAAKSVKPFKRAESELFREPPLKILALSEAEIGQFWLKISQIFHISETYSNHEKSRYSWIKMIISQLTTKLETSMEAPRKAQILLFRVVLFVLLFDSGEPMIDSHFQKE